MICTHCDRDLSFEMYGVDRSKNGLNGRRRQCRECLNTYRREHWKTTGSKNEKALERRREYDKPYNKAYKLKSVYGITQEEFDAMKTAQSFSCAICAIPMDDRPPVVDHNHATGRVRGLLCQQCNALLGMAGDCSATLQAAIRYLVNDGALTLSGRGQT